MKEVIAKWWEQTREPLIKAVLEALRLLVLAIIPVGINFIEGVEISPEIQALILMGLKALDKYMHDFGKNNEIEWLIKGLTRF
jgi:hypothetical protein